jgi:hypothetical protein
MDMKYTLLFLNSIFSTSFVEKTFIFSLEKNIIINTIIPCL